MEEEKAIAQLLFDSNDQPQLQSWTYLPACGFDLPFGTIVEMIECFDDLGDPGLIVDGIYDYTATIGGGQVQGTLKHFFNLGGSNSYLAGIGRVGSAFEGNQDIEDLIYTRIDGVEYGTPVITVANEADVPSEAIPALTIYPNPLRESATLRFVLPRPQAVTLDVVRCTGATGSVADARAVGVRRARRVVRGRGFAGGGLRCVSAR